MKTSLATAAEIIHGVYAITPDWAQIEDIYQAALQALQGGIKLLQLRYKGSAHQRYQLAQHLQQACEKYQAHLVINDDLELAIQIQATGVHLGQQDIALSYARERLHPHQILGASCYNRLDLAQSAVAQGADYIAFGSVFPSPTKPHAVQVPLEIFAQAHSLKVPCVAIGGITLANASQVFQAGAHAIAVISDLFEQKDITAQTHAWLKIDMQ